MLKYAIISLLLVITGIWFIFNLLSSQGIYPFQTNFKTGQMSGPKADFSPSVLYWYKDIEAWASTYTLDPLLIATVMQIESCGDPRVVSPVGAQGLFQVMPYHFQPAEDMLDPQTNAQRGLEYLKGALEKSNGDVKRTLTGYNGGHLQIDRNPISWPEETRRYVSWGWGIYQEARLSHTPGKTLSNWLEAGGWRLCQQAEINLGLP